MAAIISDNIFLSKMSAAFRQCATIKSCPQGLEFRERERPEILVYKKINQNYFQVSGIDCHDIEQEKYTSHITGPGEKSES